MAAYFLDSSAVLKLYVAETGSNWVRSLADVAAGDEVTVAAICGPEVVAAIARRARGYSISVPDAALAIREFQRDFATEFEVIEITGGVIADAMRLAERHALRGYDAVQLAAALAVNAAARSIGTSAILVSADMELNSAASAEGLMIEDPNTHP